MRTLQASRWVAGPGRGSRREVRRRGTDGMRETRLTQQPPVKGPIPPCPAQERDKKEQQRELHPA